VTDPRNSQGVELVWNKGIAALCDWRIPDEFPDSGGQYSPVTICAGAMSSRKLRHDLISDYSVCEHLREGEIIWVRLSWLNSFVRQILPRLNAKFVLVTADSDSSTPSEVPATRTLLKCPHLLHWYTQNYDGTKAEGRISPIPIGIDFHMLSERPIWGELLASPPEQEGQLKAIADALLPLEDRIPQVYVDFEHRRRFFLRRFRFRHPLPGTRFQESRWRIARKLKHNQSVVFQPDLLPRREMWRKRGRYAFVLSPHGNGLDCHRTWEALALGHIVLVPSSSLNNLYEGLPVVPLKSWSDITFDNLEKWLHVCPHTSLAQGKLTSRYWIERMRSMASTMVHREQETATELHS
jgi:hypothetical protein